MVGYIDNEEYFLLTEWKGRGGINGATFNTTLIYKLNHRESWSPHFTRSLIKVVRSSNRIKGQLQLELCLKCNSL